MSVNALEPAIASASETLQALIVNDLHRNSRPAIEDGNIPFQEGPYLVQFHSFPASPCVTLRTPVYGLLTNSEATAYSENIISLKNRYNISANYIANVQLLWLSTSEGRAIAIRRACLDMGSNGSNAVQANSFSVRNMVMARCASLVLGSSFKRIASNSAKYLSRLNDVRLPSIEM